MAGNKYLPILFHDENKRKQYQERILRFFALRNFTDYKSSIMKTMNDYMFYHQNADDTEIAIVNDIIFYTLMNHRLIVGTFRSPPHPFGHHSK